MRSVQSINPFKSVIHTIYSIVKAHGWELKVEALPAEASAQAGSEFIIQLPIV